MKKQFFRVKQLADQTFLRADKSERLNHEELQDADHKVEYLRTTLIAVSKRIPAVGSTNAQGSEAQQDKRMKKYPEYQLGQVMVEQGSKEKSREYADGRADDLLLLQPVLQKCGKVQQDLARDQADHESKVEQLISAPLQTVLDIDLPNVSKHKKNLSKLILDKDSATSRYTAANKHGTQKEALKDEMEEADSKVEQSRDALAAEMFSLLKRESEFAQYMLQLLKLQRAYHEVALKNLEDVIPELEKEIGDSHVKSVYGASLQEHLRVSKRRIAFPLELCVCALTELGMAEEGLFRVAGGVARVRRLKLSIDSGCLTLPLLDEYRDVHVIANTLKSYLRELPEPLLSNLLYNEWMNAARQSTEEQRLKAIHDTLKKLPPENIDNLSYLIHFLAKLSKTPNNKMTPQNIAIVFAPNLLWNINQEVDMHMTSCTVINMIVEMFINKVDKLFPDEVPVYLTIKQGDIIEEFSRPALHVFSTNNYYEGSDVTHSQYATSETASPRPTTRKKNKPAPVPPIASKVDSGREKDKANHYQDYNYSDSDDLKRRSLNGDSNANLDVKQENRINARVVANTKQTESTEMQSHATLSDVTDACYFVQPVVVDVHVPQPKHIHKITALNSSAERITVTSENVQQKSNVNVMTMSDCSSSSTKEKSKPVPTPRVSLSDSNKSLNTVGTAASVKRTPSITETVLLRRSSKEDIITERCKPAIPERPASLKPGSDVVLQKTQCSLSSVAPKQTPSLVQLSHRSGHDSQMAEKEKFLGQNQHHDDVNSNCQDNSRYRTQSVGKKAERPTKLEQISTNGNVKVTSHVRTRSDGNLIDIGNAEGRGSPTSPRCTTKPQEPPPPPPTIIKTSSESTDL